MSAVPVEVAPRYLDIQIRYLLPAAIKEQAWPKSCQKLVLSEICDFSKMKWARPCLCQGVEALEILEVIPGSPLDKIDLKKGEMICCVEWECGKKCPLPQTSSDDYHNEYCRMHLCLLPNWAQCDQEDHRDCDLPKDRVLKLEIRMVVQDQYEGLCCLWSANEFEKQPHQQRTRRTLYDGLAQVRKEIAGILLEGANSVLSILTSCLFIFKGSPLRGKDRLKISQQTQIDLISVHFKSALPCQKNFFSSTLLIFVKWAIFQTILSLLPFQGTDSFMCAKILYTDILSSLQRKKGDLKK